MAEVMVDGLKLFAPWIRHGVCLLCTDTEDREPTAPLVLLCHRLLHLVIVVQIAARSAAQLIVLH